MNKSHFTLLLLLAVGFVFVAEGCKDSTTNTDDKESVPNDIFPLTTGHRFEYTGYLTSADTENKIAGTDIAGVYSTSWTIGSPATPLAAVFAPLGVDISHLNRTSATLVYDTTMINGVLPAPKFTPVFAYYDTATSDYYYLTNLGNFFRNFTVKLASDTTKIRGDSLRFIKLASPSAKLGGTFNCLTEDFSIYQNPTSPATITLSIDGKWESKVDLTLGGTTYTTYYVVITRTASLGTTPVSTGVTAKLWFAQGIGPVRMFLAGTSDGTEPGNYRELSLKNF